MKRFLLIWLVGACLVAFGLAFGYGSYVHRLYALSRRGASTVGTVTGFEPHNHNTVRYSFEVNGKTISGSQQGDVGGDTTTSSEHVVFYLPEDPYVSCMGNPKAMLLNEEIFIGIGVFVFVPLMLLGVCERSPRFRQWLVGKQKAK